MSVLKISQQWLRWQELDEILNSDLPIELDDTTKKSIQTCRDYLDLKIEKSSDLIYGINTGFGSLHNVAISNEDLGKLQTNLVRSHACGAGELVPIHIVRRMLLLKILGLSKGKSGVQVETVERLIFFYNNQIFPVVYQQGSLGASGDLAPLAHLSLPIIGEGEVFYDGQIQATEKVYQKLNLEVITLKSKEGLALLNGTQFMSAYASYAVASSFKIWNQYNFIAAMSIDAYDGRMNPFQKNVNQIRNQKGQIETASQIQKVLEESEISTQKKQHVQDPYSFRCIPQVHGASLDTFKHCAKIVEREINAVTDNPTVFPEDDEVVSAGNFHGQPLAIAMDYLAIALSELGSISERRIYKLISGTRNLPAFLVANPGLNSGFMIPQYTCASIVSQNKQLCTPASIDTIDSSNGQEDHVSMGANAATKLARIIENCYTIQGIELFNAAQALEFRRPLKSSDIIEDLHKTYRQIVPFIKDDEYLHPHIEKSKEFVRNLIIS